MSRISFEEYAKQNVAKLVDYAVKRLYLDDYDVIYAQNLLLDALSLTEPYEGALKPYDIYETLDKLSDYAVRKKLIEEHEKLNFETKLMGMVMPSPSKTVDMFDDICAQKGVKAATDFLFKFSEDCTYLRRPDRKDPRAGAPRKARDGRISKVHALRRELGLGGQRRKTRKADHPHHSHRA